MIITSEYKYKLNWQKCPRNGWLDFLAFSLEGELAVGAEGIYMIWHGVENPAVVCVGQGNIKNELAARRQEQKILQHKDKGLFVSWAEVCSAYREGAQKYLMNLWQPKLSEAHFNLLPVKVNSPWE